MLFIIFVAAYAPFVFGSTSPAERANGLELGDKLDTGVENHHRHDQDSHEKNRKKKKNKHLMRREMKHPNASILENQETSAASPTDIEVNAEGDRPSSNSEYAALDELESLTSAIKLEANSSAPAPEDQIPSPEEQRLQKLQQRFENDSKAVHLFEKEEAAPASVEAEMMSLSQKKGADRKPFIMPEDDDIDHDAVLDELEGISGSPHMSTLTNLVDNVWKSLRPKGAPPRQDCRWEEWHKKGRCMPSGFGSCGVSGEEEYTRSKIPEKYGGEECHGSKRKTESGCQLPACPPTPAPTPPPTMPLTTTMALGTRLHVGLASFMGLFVVILINLH